MRKVHFGRLRLSSRTGGQTVPLRGRGRYLRKRPRAGVEGVAGSLALAGPEPSGTEPEAERNASRPSGVPSTILGARRLFRVPRGGVGTPAISSFGVISLFSSRSSTPSSPFHRWNGVFRRAGKSEWFPGRNRCRDVTGTGISWIVLPLS